MATQPVMLQSRVAHLAFWDRFQRELDRQVQDCNTVAGEPLWAVSRAAEPLHRIAVESAGRSKDRIECSFDEEKGLLECLAGSSPDAAAMLFEWAGGTLRRDGREYSLEETLRILLDRLVCSEED